ncbi:hypothetical protein FN846DRAFT_735680 [Sphaerosporella brunnea]|uniref:C2H2-type domain-containing protein n=1 Tax=Sphaerosporella brunnea TaxID=1250544 RepID=A0A5J5EXH3_9PEZI|nr:hypothetical protein FN846DRAFT_735680 [Sphaerosporella brunnea]
MSSNTTNIAAVAQAVKEAAEAQMAVGAAVVGSPGIGKPHQSGTGSVAITGYPSPPGSVPTPSILSTAMAANDSIQQLRKNGGTTLLNGSAIAEGHAPEVNRGARNRRSSDGAGALGGAGKMGRMRSGSELKCDKCGKGYKHSSCLTKHLWEHTPEWSYTSKLLISKHQQVQLLEAASILVSMNPTPPDSSSGASNNEGNSSANDSSSSEETTPPPSGMSLPSPVPTPRGIRNGAGKPGKRYSSGSYSRSYNSSSGGFLPGSVPTMGLSFPNHIPQRPPPRPRTGSSTSAIRGSVAPSPSLRATSNSEEDALAAAVELLSCSFNTPVIPPTIPAGSIPRGLGLSDFGSPPAGGRRFMGPLNDVVEMKMEEDEEEDEDEEDDVRMEDNTRTRGDDDEGWNRRGRSEEEEDGVFGRMEE